MNRSAIISIPGNRKKDSSVQVLQIHKGRFDSNQEDDYLPEGIYVCHAPLSQTLKEETWIDSQQVDAVIVGPDCSVADIVSIREITTRNSVPLIFHTLKYDWKAREISIESRVDEYHIGFLDRHFIKRIMLIKRVKSLTNTNQDKKVRRFSQEGPSIQLLLLKRSFDIVIASLVILSLLPILIVIIPLLLLETHGSILSSSKRVGKNYRVFGLYKFACISSNEGNRIDLIRKFLRKAHLVGLPQLLNVFVGDMSLVGNHPIHEKDAERFTKDEFAWRFLAPVGIVGLWRFSSMEENKMSGWKSDIEYAKANSIWLDMKILFFHFGNLLTVKLHEKAKQWALSLVKKKMGMTISVHQSFTYSH